MSELISIGGKEFRTLDDVIRANGHLVKKVTVDGALVYPEPSKVRKYEWAKDYWLRLSGKLRLYYVRRDRSMNNLYTIPSPSVVWSESRCSALFNSDLPMPVISGLTVTPTIYYDPVWDGYYREYGESSGLTYEGNMRRDVETLGLLPHGNCICELAIETSCNWPVSHTRFSNSGYRRDTRIFDGSYTDKHLVRVIIDDTDGKTTVVARSGDTNLAIGADRHTGHPEWPLTQYGPLTGVLTMAREERVEVMGMIDTYAHSIPVAEERVFSASYMNVSLGYAPFDTIEYANYDVDEANRMYAIDERVRLPFVIPPDGECRVML